MTTGGTNAGYVKVVPLVENKPGPAFSFDSRLGTVTA
jgi:hypothetical protein